MGHVFNSLAIGTLLVTPFIIKSHDKSIWLYALSYTCIRYALFDLTYNASRGLPLDYVGNSAYTDRAIKKTGRVVILGTKVVALSIGFYIPIKYF